MMPTVHPNGMDIYYEVPGGGDPLVLIPYFAAGQACGAFPGSGVRPAFRRLRRGPA